LKDWLFQHRFGLWAFAVASAFIPGIMSNALAGRYAAIALGVPLVAPLAWRFSPPIKACLAAGLAWSAASLMIAPDPYDSALQLYFMVLLIGVMGAASQVQDLDGPLSGACLGVGVSSAVCLVGLLGYEPVDQSQFGPLHYAGLFYNSEVLTEFAAPLLVWAILKNRPLLVACTILPLLINGSRVAVGAAGVALVYGFWPRSGRARVALLCAAALALAAVLLYLTAANHKLGSIGLRLIFWLSTIYAITPLGHGLGWFRSANLSTEFAHSDVLQALAELGLGACSFAVIPVFIFLRRGQPRAEIAAFIVLAIELVVSFPLHVPASAFLVAVLAGYLARDCDPLYEPRPDSRIHHGPHGQWQSSGTGHRSFRSGLRGLPVSLRHAVARISPLGALRGRAQACPSGGLI
jgi:hypothetical protein